MSESNCSRCQKPAATCELVAYRGICENCWNADAPPANCGARMQLDSMGKWQKVDGEMVTVAYEGRASRDGRMK